MERKDASELRLARRLLTPIVETWSWPITKGFKIFDGNGSDWKRFKIDFIYSLASRLISMHGLLGTIPKGFVTKICTAAEAWRLLESNYGVKTIDSRIGRIVSCFKLKYDPVEGISELFARSSALLDEIYTDGPLTEGNSMPLSSFTPYQPSGTNNLVHRHRGARRM